MQARWRTVVTIGLIAVLLLPLAGIDDGVPLSSYPMYARPRSPDITFIVPVGQSVSGEDITLTPLTIAGTADPLIVESYLRGEVRAGRVEALCSGIAKRIADERITTIVIRSERQNVIDQVLDPTSSTSRELLTSCFVP